ncbi:MAG: MarR family transcriptional regulator, partial [Thermoanaerobaculia bacterium]
IRFTVSEEARRKILDRLSQLNRERYEEEVAQGLHDKKKPTKGARAAKSSKSAAGITAEPFAPPPQQTLFPMKDQMGLWEAPQPSTATEKDSETGSDGLSRSAADLLAWLRKESDWRSRSEALEALGLSTSEWNQAIQELLAAGLAERKGEKRGTRYRAK